MILLADAPRVFLTLPLRHHKVSDRCLLRIWKVIRGRLAWPRCIAQQAAEVLNIVGAAVFYTTLLGPVYLAVICQLVKQGLGCLLTSCCCWQASAVCSCGGLWDDGPGY